MRHKVCLTNYPTKCATTFDSSVVITACEITGFTINPNPLSPTFDKTYTVDDPMLSWSLATGGLTTQAPLCNYAEIFTINYSPAFLSPSTFTSVVVPPLINYSVWTRDIAEAGIRTLSVTSTLQGYSVTSPLPVPITVTGTYKLTTVDPCILTTFTTIPTVVQNFIAFAGYNSTSLATYAFQDS